MKFLEFIKKFFFLINIIFSLYSLLVYQVVYSADIGHWFAGFLMLSFPLVLAGHIFFIISWIISKSSRFFLSFVLLIITFPILNRTFKVIPQDIQLWQPFSFSVISYNTMYSDYNNFIVNDIKINAEGIANTLDTLSADIKCFQELYNNDKYPQLSLLNMLSNKSEYYVYMHSQEGNSQGQGAIGLAIFSRFPIISKKEVYWPPNNNGILMADLAVEKDTIRVINVQLRSMGIRIQKVLDDKNQLNRKETKNVFSLLKDGFADRAIQVNQLEKWILESPYPIILAGDFNELPYGYSYGKVRNLLNNSFESTGFGFGFTYHKILNFLRIDNQFYDKTRIQNISFETYQNIPFSDHYPIKAWYLVK